jgi:hypothetical protein
MMTPKTEAGKRLLDAGVVYRSWYPVEQGAILAIEAEAVAAILSALRERVEGLESWVGTGTMFTGERYVDRAAVLAIINQEETDHD